MATMTISEAEHVIDIVVAVLLQEPTTSKGEDKRSCYWHNYTRLSILQGYDVFQIDTALKLRLANMFLFLAKENDFEEKFTKEIRICTLPAPALSLFIPDDLMAKYEQLDKLSKTLSRDSLEFLERETSINEEFVAFRNGWRKKLLPLETASSFGKYCRCVGANDPIYWQKVYTRIGIEYTSTSPKGNTPVYPETNPDDYDDNEHSL